MHDSPSVCHPLPADATLMSTTDTEGRITYANAALAEASGYGIDELIGQPHRLLRHPDMPAQAFADMWATLQGGEPWSAVIKNRRKDGRAYWARTSATPLVRGERTVGFMAVHTCPAPAEVAVAERLHAELNAGAAGVTRRYHKGLVVRTGAMRWTMLFQTMSMRWRVRWALLAMAPACVAAAWAFGLREPAGLAGFAAVVAALATGVAVALEMAMTRPLELLRRLALRVATGESQAAVHMNRVDEIGMSLRTVSQLGLMFRWLIGDVSGQVLRVQQACSDIASSNDDLHARTEQASASVQQTATSMAQVTASVRANTEAAQQAETLSGTASSAAEQGGQAVAQVVQRMAEISHSARRIADIIGLIDGIAFQTNILALNAATEAARAGEHGRGFAVVAGEVRSLALRSAEAAAEIKGLIGTSVDQVTRGTALVDQTGRTMADIVEQVRRVSSLIGEISRASAQQSGGISQVDRAVGHLDELTRHHAVLVRHSASASQSLQQQATRLLEAVSVFR